MTYSTPQLCVDGRTRRSVWYRCTPSHADAERKAWAHVEAVLNRGGDAAAVDPRFGLGELQGTGRIRHHGDAHEDFKFRVHPRRPDFKHAASSVWKPQRDTLLKPEEYCTNHVFSMALASGAKIYKCLGHDATTGQPDKRAWPDCFKDGPLRGLVLVEVFSGRLRKEVLVSQKLGRLLGERPFAMTNALILLTTSSKTTNLGQITWPSRGTRITSPSLVTT